MAPTASIFIMAGKCCLLLRLLFNIARRVHASEILSWVTLFHIRRCKVGQLEALISNDLLVRTIKFLMRLLLLALFLSDLLD